MPNFTQFPLNFLVTLLWFILWLRKHAAIEFSGDFIMMFLYLITATLYICSNLELIILNSNVPNLIIFFILQMKLWECHWLFRQVYGFIYMAAAVYMARMTSGKLHCDVMKTNYWPDCKAIPAYSWCHSKFFQYNFETLGMFLSPQHLICLVSAQLECFSGVFIFNEPFFGLIFLMVQKKIQIRQKIKKKKLEITLTTPFLNGVLYRICSMTKILFQLLKGNLVSYTLSGFYIPLASGLGNIKSKQRIWDHIPCLDNIYSKTLKTPIRKCLIFGIY